MASANDSQRTTVILSPSRITAMIAVRTGMVRVSTDAFEASECSTPHVSPSCDGMTPSVPAKIRSRTTTAVKRGFGFWPRLRRTSGANNMVERASGMKVTVTGPKRSVAIFAPENWKAHIRFTTTSTRKYWMGRRARP